MQLSFMLEAEQVYTRTWMLGKTGLPKLAEIMQELLGAAEMPIITYAAIAKKALDLDPAIEMVPDDLTDQFTDMKKAIHDNRSDLKDLLQEQGWLLVACDRVGRPALGKSGGKAEGFALMASPTGNVHTEQQVNMALANATKAVHSRRVAGLLDGQTEQAALEAVDRVRQLLLPAAPEPVETI